MNTIIKQRAPSEKQCLGRSFRTFHRCRRKGEWRLFCHDHRWQPVLLAISFLGILASVIQIWTYFSPAMTELVLVNGPTGGKSIKASPTGFEREITQIVTKRAEEARTYFYAAEYDFHSERYMDATIGYKKSLDVFETMSAYMNLGTALYYEDLNDEAEKALVAGLRLAQKNNKPRLIAAFQTSLGSIYQRNKEFDKALSSINESLSIDKGLKNISGEAINYSNIGLVYRDRGDYDNSLLYLEKAQVLFKKINDKVGYTTVINNIGSTYKKMNNKETALKYYEEALELANQYGNEWMRGSMLLNLGLIHQSIGNYSKALVLFEESEQRFISIGNKVRRAKVLSNMGLLYFDQGDMGEALGKLQMSRKLYNESGDKSGEAGVMNNISFIYRSQREFKQAREILTESLRIFTELSDISGGADTLANMGFCYMEEGDNEKAMYLLKKANILYGRSDVKTHASALVEKAMNRLTRKMLRRTGTGL